MANTNPPTVKSTKADLLAAFEEMRKKYEESAKQTPTATKEEEKRIVERVAQFTPTKLDEAVADLRKKIQTRLDDILEQLNSESKKLTDIKEATNIEAERLAEMYNIDITVTSLKTSIEEYDEKTKSLRLDYKKTQEELEEAIIRKKKDWEREQEEYSYSLKLGQRKDNDAFELESTKKENKWKEEMAKREQQIEELESALQKRAEEIAVLEKTSAELPEKIRLTEETAAKAAGEKARAEYNLEIKLKTQEWQAEKMMLQSKIEALSDAAKLQTEEIKSLKTALNSANQQAQTLAATVVENMVGNKNTKPAENL